MGVESDYMKGDGCKLATDYLNEQSHCAECPFPDCLLGTVAGADLRKQLDRNQAIQKLRKQKGLSVQELQKIYPLSQAMIYHILAGGKQS